MLLRARWRRGGAHARMGEDHAADLRGRFPSREPFGFKLSPGSGEAFVVIAGRPCLCGFRARAKVRAVVTADLREPPGGRHDTELDGLLLILTVIAIMTIVCALFL